MLDNTVTALLKSDSKRENFDRPDGHSSTPYSTTLNFLSELTKTLDLSPRRGCCGVFFAVRTGSVEPVGEEGQSHRTAAL